MRKGLVTGAVFGSVFAASTFLGWYSFLDLPVYFLILLSSVYFIEFIAVGFVFGLLYRSGSTRKKAWFLACAIILILIFGIVI